MQRKILHELSYMRVHKSSENHKFPIAVTAHNRRAPITSAPIKPTKLLLTFWALFPPPLPPPDLISVAVNDPFWHLKPKVSCSPCTSVAGSQITLVSLADLLKGWMLMSWNVRFKAAIKDNCKQRDSVSEDWKKNSPVPGNKSMMTACVASPPSTWFQQGLLMQVPSAFR